jgi:hypothetical protein
MARVFHKLSNIRPKERLGDCARCGPGVKVYIRRDHRPRKTLRRFRVAALVSWRCFATKPSGEPNEHRRFKGQMCERCGFIPQHRCQLDVHHIDGNHKNNRADNLQTLCANCHRLDQVGQLDNPLPIRLRTLQKRPDLDLQTARKIRNHYNLRWFWK